MILICLVHLWTGHWIGLGYVLCSRGGRRLHEAPKHGLDVVWGGVIIVRQLALKQFSNANQQTFPIISCIWRTSQLTPQDWTHIWLESIFQFPSEQDTLLAGLPRCCGSQILTGWVMGRWSTHDFSMRKTSRANQFESDFCQRQLKSARHTSVNPHQFPPIFLCPHSKLLNDTCPKERQTRPPLANQVLLYFAFSSALCTQSGRPFLMGISTGHVAMAIAGGFQLVMGTQFVVYKNI